MPEGYHPCTLRFKSDQAEAAFLKQRMASLVRLMTAITMLGAVLIGATLIRCNFMRPVTEKARENHRVTMSSLGGNFALLLLFLMALQCRQLMKRLGPAKLEVLGILMMVTTLCVSVLTMPVYVCHMRRWDVHKVHGEDFYVSDSRALLVIQVLITATHLGLPARWFVMLTMEVIAVAIYAATVFAIGSAEPTENACINLALLSGLVWAFAAGKRADEVRERRTFLQIAEERSKRCEAEFELWQTKDQFQMQAPAAADTRSHADSTVPTAAPSDQLFNGLDIEPTDVEDQLAQISAMCEKEHWRIRQEELAIFSGQVLGQGGFGLVARGVFCGMPVAVKLPKPLQDMTTLRAGGLLNELRVLRYLRHPNIVTTYGAIIEPEDRRLALVMELVRGEVLTEFLLTGSAQPSDRERYQIMLGLGRALLYMHTRTPKLVHGDLKASNVMVEQLHNGVQPKLLDFGLSRVLTRQAKPLGGTVAWIAPEVLVRSGPPRCSADIYSLGRLLAMVATNLLPLSGLSPNKLKRAFKTNKLPLPVWPNGCAFEITCKPLVHACLAQDESMRPDMVQVHSKLLHVSTEMNLDLDGLEDVRAVAASQSTGDFAEPTEPSSIPSTSEPVHSQPEQRMSHLPSLPEDSRLPSLPEDDPVSVAEESFKGERENVSVSRWSGRCRETCEMAMEQSLLQAVCRWCYKCPPDACCEEHARIRVAKDLCETILARQCIHAPLPKQRVQCKSCGIMGIDEQCDLCGCRSRIAFHEV